MDFGNRTGFERYGEQSTFTSYRGFTVKIMNTLLFKIISEHG